MNKSEKLAELRHSLARYGLPPDRPSVPLGCGCVDAVLGGACGPAHCTKSSPRGWARRGFAVLLAMLTAGTKPLFWVRPDYETMEYGALSPGRPCGTGRRSAPAGDGEAPAVPPMPCRRQTTSWRVRMWAPVSGTGRRPQMPGLGRQPQAGTGGARKRRHGHHAALWRAAQPSAALTRWQVASAPSSPLDDDWGDAGF